jgi:hypothetical protein
MRTLDRDTDRRSIEARLARLTPDHRARWGSFDVGKMIVHVEDALRLYLGEIVRTSPPASAFHPVRHFPLKQFVIYLMPFPKGAPTTPNPWPGSIPATSTASAYRSSPRSNAS